MKHITIATRGSSLALWQANYIKSLLEKNNPTCTIDLSIIKTKGDKILDVPLSKVGGKGLFVKEIEEALLDGRADLAVHSMKDVPMVLPDSLLLACVPKRAQSEDMFLSHKYPTFGDLPKGAVVGTSSLRRQSQLLAKRSDISVVSLRGNVDTRVRKLAEGQFDAIILACAGVERLNVHAKYMQVLPHDVILPAVGQGALGIECLESNYDVLCMLAELEDSASRVCVTAERSFLRRLDGGCQVPIAGHASMISDDTLEMAGLVGTVDGEKLLFARLKGETVDASKIGTQVAQLLLTNGADTLLKQLYTQ